MGTAFYKKDFIYEANRYEEWLGGRCISQGRILTKIIAEIRGNKIYFQLDNIDKIRILSSFDFEIAGKDFSILPDRIQYSSSNIILNPITPFVCHLFTNGSTIEYVRFAMTNPDRLVEFYGQLTSYNSPKDSSCESDDSFDFLNAQPSKQEIETLIKTITKIELLVSNSHEGYEAYQLNQVFEMFKIPLCFAWQGYKYGWHTDFCEEGDSLLPFTLYELDMKEKTKELINLLESNSPFVFIERNSSITNSLIKIYKSFLNDIVKGIIRF